MKVCCFCFNEKKEIVILRVKFFNESIKQIAKEVASKFPGVTKVVEVEGECQLEVRGEFSISGLTKKLKKIDASVETNKIVSDGVTEPEIKIQPRDEGKRPIKIQKASKPLNDGASSSNGTASQNYGSLMWEQAKGVGAGAAEQAKAIGVGAAEKAKAIGAEAFNLLPNNMKWNYAKKNDRKENMAVVLHCEEEEMKEKKIRQEKEKEKKRIALAEEEMKQKKIKQEKEEERKKQALADEMKRQKKMKEEGKRRKQALAEEEEKQKKIKQEREDEKRRRQALENNSGGTSMVAGITGSLWNAVSTVTNASAQTLGDLHRSISTQTQRTGQPSTSTYTQRTTQPSTGSLWNTVSTATNASTQTLGDLHRSIYSTQTQRTGQPSTSTYTQRTRQPSTSTQNPFSTQRGNTTS